jgi:hypothetical protein
VVPFGFGLSYTTFSYSLAASSATLSLDPVRAMLRETADARKTFPRAEFTEGERARLVRYTVSVTNHGSMDADDAVLGFLVPPGAGKDGAPLQSLFGFERVHVEAGQTVSVDLYPALTDFALTALDGTKCARAGEWTVRFGVPETAKLGQGFAETKLTAV